MYYIGFDLGDGESSLCYWNDEFPSISPKSIPITLKNSFATAVAVVQDTGETVIGMKAVTNAPNLTDLRVCFKRDFKRGTGDTNESFRRFIAGVLAELRKAELPFDIDDPAQCRFVVGQPADWDSDTLKRYKNLLAVCGIHDPYMTSESRAALVYLNAAKYMQAYDSIGTSTLVCDFGSSTLDFAYSDGTDSDNVLIFGDPRLGGGLMDEQIVLESIRRISDPEKRDYAMELFRNHPDIRSRLMYYARMIKEKFFDDPSGEPRSVPVPIFHTKLSSMNVFIDNEVINNVIMYPQPLLDNNSFYQQLHNQLEKVLEVTQKNPPKIVVLTGGASRMQFFRDICTEMFRNFEAEIVFSDSPDLDISYGLALDGGYLAKMDILKQKLSEFAESDKAERIVADMVPSLIHHLANGVISVMTDKQKTGYSIQQIFASWKQKEEPQSLNDMKALMETNISKLTNTQEFYEEMEKVVTPWMETVFQSVQIQLDAICNSIGINPVYVQLKRVKLMDSLEIDGKGIEPGIELIHTLDFIATTVTAIVVGCLSGGVGTVLIAEGPIGVMIGVLIVGAFRLAVGEHAQNLTMELKLPKLIRKAVPEIAVFNKVTLSSMEKSVEKEILEKSDMNRKVQDILSQYIDSMINAIACQTRV